MAGRKGGERWIYENLTMAEQHGLVRRINGQSTLMTEVGVQGKAVGSRVAEFARQQRNAPVRSEDMYELGGDYDSMRGEEKGDFQINCYRSMWIRPDSRSIYGVPWEEQSFEGQNHQKSTPLVRRILKENRI